MANERPLVAVAMSGGVDSAVAAALLQEQGQRLLGVTMRLWREDAEDSAAGDAAGGDAAGGDAAGGDAARVCAALGIAHKTIDLRAAFLSQVVDPFVRDYAAGRTPNPCLACNRALKFGLLLDHALGLGARHLATGHYARSRCVAGDWQLLVAADARKDQSYVLYALGQRELAHLLFPLGELTKAEVRAHARRLGLPAAERPESQDICFLRDNDYRRFLAERAPGALRPGPILDVEGRVLGEHRGLPYYTVGQREGLGVAAAHPLYVKCLDAARNALVVGYAEQLGRSELSARDVSWVEGRPPEAATVVQAAIRYRARRVAAQVWPLVGARCRVSLEQALRDITPGQAVVLYSGERVLGGGIIEG